MSQKRNWNLIDIFVFIVKWNTVHLKPHHLVLDSCNLYTIHGFTFKIYMPLEEKVFITTESVIFYFWYGPLSASEHYSS